MMTSYYSFLEVFSRGLLIDWNIEQCLLIVTLDHLFGVMNWCQTTNMNGFEFINFMHISMQKFTFGVLGFSFLSQGGGGLNSKWNDEVDICFDD